jgi:hypothetical protein
MEEDKQTELYRHFDADGNLLYVGISLSVLHRLRRHRQKSAWFGRIVRITIERFATREIALAAEKAAIQVEHPRFNCVHTGSRMKEPEPLERLAVRMRQRREARAAKAAACS